MNGNLRHLHSYDDEADTLLLLCGVVPGLSGGSLRLAGRARLHALLLLLGAGEGGDGEAEDGHQPRHLRDLVVRENHQRVQEAVVGDGELGASLQSSSAARG